MKPLRELLQHSSVYAVGQILNRLASVLLLPLYTHCLSTADYGVTAILDLTAVILSLMIGGGMVSAVTRFHFDGDSSSHRDRLWWTGLTYLAMTSCVVLLPMWMGRQVLSDLTLGNNYPNGARLYTLTLATIIVQNVGQLVEAYLRVLKWSGLFVAISLGRLLLNVSLNVWLLVGMDMGVEGLLLGNLTASAIHAAALMIVFLKTRGAFRFDLALSIEMLRFSTPLLVTAIMAMLMHELKTPLNAILGFSDLMGTLADTLSPDQIREYAGLVHQGGTNLLKMINQIMDLTKISAGRYELRRTSVDAGGVLWLTRDVFNARAQARNITIDAERCPVGLMVDADEGVFTAMMHSLVDNAVTYSRAGGIVTLSADICEDGVAVTVEDDGMGVRDEDLARIQEPFEHGGQAAEGSQHTKGAGLGLTLVKAFAELHGGKLTLTSQLGEGFKATVTLPSAPLCAA